MVTVMKKILSLFLATLMALSSSAVAVTPMLANPQEAVTPYTSVDGRLQIQNGQLVVSPGSEVIYYTKQSFSGSYTIEMKATVTHQAVGLLFGSGSPFQPLWLLATVSPNGLWAHHPGDWSQVDRVASNDVQNGVPVTIKIDISGTTVTTSLNGAVVHTCTLPAANTSGPLGLRFSTSECGSVDYIHVTQNGSTVWSDDFDTLDNIKWNYPPALETEMSPVWAGTTAYDETVWPIAGQDGTMADLPLLYQADEILSVQNLSRSVTYQQGRDYTLVNGKLHIPSGSTIPVMPYADYHPSSGTFQSSKGGYIYWPGETTDIISRQIYVTYKHSDAWPFATPGDQSSQLPNTLAKLRAGGTLNMVFYGDSITQGYNSSAFLNTAPYEPSWSGLVTQAIGQAFPRAKVNMTNTAVAGQTSDWGAQNVESRVNAYNPDLVVIAFGMNDHCTADAFVANMRTIMNAAKAKNPNCEFVLVSTTLPNPDAVGFLDKQEQYGPAMISQLKGAGVTVADMTAMHKNLLTKKAFGDMTGNNVNHPNDYLCRVYAQTVYRTILGDNKEQQLALTNIPYVQGSTLPAQTLDIRLPSGVQGPYPVVVFIHGGAWVAGDKVGTEAQGALDAAVNAGYAVVSINYRLAQNARWPAQIYDCKAAVRFLRANAQTYGLDPDRIAVWGASAGAHLAQFMGVTNGDSRYEDLSMGSAGYSSDVQAVLSWYGISDLTTWNIPSSLSDITTTGKDPVTTLLGDGYTRAQALDASPVSHISKTAVPMYIAHGMNDTLVNADESTVFAEKLRAAIGYYQVDTYFPAQGQHADTAFWNSADSIKPALNFLQKRFFPTKNLDSIENTRPSYGTVDLSGYTHKYLNLPYASTSAQGTQKLHIVLPDTGTGPYPLIIFVHGGGFAGGNSSGTQAIFTAQGPLEALGAGYAVAVVDYRTAPEAYFPQPVYDVKAAVRFLRANAKAYHLDPYNFAVWGESAGGLLADFVGATNGDPQYEDLSMGNASVSSAVQAVVSFYAITDMTTAGNAQYCPNFLGGSQAQNQAKALDASPVTHITAAAPPYFIEHGMADNEVDYHDSVNLFNKLAAVSKNPDTTLQLFPGLTHAVRQFIAQENVDEVTAWLGKVLVNGAPDTTALKKAVSDAQALDMTDYLPAGQQAFQAALSDAQAVLQQGYLTAAQVENARSALAAAAGALVKKADKAALTAALQKVKDVDLSQYTKESAAAFQKALDDANALAADGTLSQADNARVTAAADGLLAAYDSLTLLPEQESKPSGDSAPQSAPGSSQPTTSSAFSGSSSSASSAPVAGSPATGGGAPWAVALAALFSGLAAGLGWLFVRRACLRSVSGGR